jgi:ubiquinone/menaquinone biosynthesis C-methylase UbiE
MNEQEREARWADGAGYDRYIQDELHTFRKDAWKRQLTQHFAHGMALDILDVGTGPGFFACILSEEGHRVTGIDASDGMLERARANAAALGVQPVFLKMDINELDYPDEAFDAIVLRNVSWTLQYPERVYTEFKRLLRPGGVLLVYDANWQMQWFDPAILERVRARERRFFEKYGREEIVSNGDMAYYATAPLTRIWRPAWDEKTLTDLGFAVTVTEDVGQFVYGDWEKELYGESPLFEVCAVKQAEGEALKNMHEYWQYRAETFGVGGMEELRALGREAAPCLPEGKMRVLDVGTGPGTVAMAMALLGHDVTGIDLSSNMIRRARENAAALGLDIQFLNTAAGELPFPDESFDAVVSRNLTWALPEPEATFRQWRRVLKPGGRLLYWDANHYYFYFNETDAKNREALEKLAGTVHILHRDENGNPQQLDYSLCERTAPNLPLSRFDRPSGWDETALPSLGFTILAERIYRPQHLLKYGVAKGYYTEFFIAAIRD